MVNAREHFIHMILKQLKDVIPVLMATWKAPGLALAFVEIGRHTKKHGPINGL